MIGLRLISLGNKLSLESLYKSNQIFLRSCLKLASKDDLLNANSTLSNIQTIKTRQSFFKDYKTDNPSLGDVKTFYKFCVMFLQFYKHGIKNVYQNYKTVRELKNNFYVNNKDVIPGVKNQHHKIKINDTNQLVKLFSNTIRNYQNEYKLTLDITKLFDNPQNIEITRSQFQKILRTSRDIYKLPLFAVLFLLLEEFTVLLCYIFPDLTPSTCLIPQLTSRFYKSAANSQQRLYELTLALSLEEMMVKSAYSVSELELKELVGFLQLKSRYLPRNFYTEDRLRDLVQLRFQEIIIDNYLILRDGGIWNLSKLELIDACLKRGLIDLQKFVQLSKTKDANFIDLIDTDKLRLKLFKHVNNSFLEGTNVGILSLKDPEEELISENGAKLLLDIQNM